LDIVSVLEFVDQQVGKAFTVVVKQMRFIKPKLMSAEEEFCKID
jgi:hypothetical protein